MSDAMTGAAIALRQGGPMHYDGIYVTGVGVRLGDQVRTPAMVRRGALAVADVRRTRQRSVCVAPEGSGGSGPELAVAAARQAVRGHEQTTGLRPAIRVHLHAQMFDKPDFWSAACFVLGQLGVTGCGVVCDIGAMSNGAVLGLDVAASLLGARPDLHTALITTGDRFAGDRFARYRSDYGVLYGTREPRWCSAAPQGSRGWCRRPRAPTPCWRD